MSRVTQLMGIRDRKPVSVTFGTPERCCHSAPFVRLLGAATFPASWLIVGSFSGSFQGSLPGIKCYSFHVPQHLSGPCRGGFLKLLSLHGTKGKKASINLWMEEFSIEHYWNFVSLGKVILSNLGFNSEYVLI